MGLWSGQIPEGEVRPEFCEGFWVHSLSSVGPVQKSITESSWISPSEQEELGLHPAESRLLHWGPSSRGCGDDRSPLQCWESWKGWLWLPLLWSRLQNTNGGRVWKVQVQVCLVLQGPMQAMSTPPPLPYLQVIHHHKENIILVWFVFLMIQNILDHSLSSTMPVWFFANILKMVKLRDQDCELFSCFWFFYNPVQYITKIARDSCQRSKLNSFLKIWKAREVKNACCCKMSGTRFCFKLARRCHTATKIVWWPKDQCCHQGFKKWQNYC